MSKLSFRARALDPSKNMPIYLAEELPDLPEYSAINRAVPQMPSGMEKEEEAEHHLQRAICTGLIIPTPEVFTTDKDFYDKNYPANYKMPRQLIHMQPLALEQDVPEYDMDSADECWVSQQSKRLDLTPLKFERMMDRLERSSGQTVVTLNEAKSLLKQDDELSIAIYDYWLNKRLKMQHPLILTVKTENRSGVSSNNPYLAFRRRTEKMQTRKNRKNDETSYEKMLRLRRDLQRVTTILEMVKQRERMKVDVLHITVDIFERRVCLRDFSGSIYSELSSHIKTQRSAFSPLYSNQYLQHAAGSPSVSSMGSVAGESIIGGSTLTSSLLTSCNTGSSTGNHGGQIYASTALQYLNSSNLDSSSNSCRKEKRQYKKRKHKIPRDKQQYLGAGGIIDPARASAYATGSGPISLTSNAHLHHFHQQSSSPAPNDSNLDTEDEEMTGRNKIGSESEDDAPFAFRRRQNCDYQRPLPHSGNWPWETVEGEKGYCPDTKYRYTLASLRYPRPRCIGFARRRLGRGGRVIFDRTSNSLDDFWSKLDFTILESKPQLITQTPANQLKEADEEYPINADNDSNSENTDSDVIIDTHYVSEINLRKQKQRNRKQGMHRTYENAGWARRRKKQISALKLLAGSLSDRQLSEMHSYLKNVKNTDSKEDVDVQAQGGVDSLTKKKRQNNSCFFDNEMLKNKNNESSNSCSVVISSCNSGISNSEKTIVIKKEKTCETDTMPIIHPTTENYDVSLAMHIKPETTPSLLEPMMSNTDDSNEPLSSLRANMQHEVINEEDEENVNLAQLSNLIKHTTSTKYNRNNLCMHENEKHQPFGVESKFYPSCGLLNADEDMTSTTLNQVEDVWRIMSSQNQHICSNRTDHNRNINEDIMDNSNLSAVSVESLDVCKDFLSEVQRDWLHFRPQTPTGENNNLLVDLELLNCESSEAIKPVSVPLVQWSQHTPLAVEMLHMEAPREHKHSISLLNPKYNKDAVFVSNFKYADLSADMELLQPSLKTPDTSKNQSIIQNPGDLNNTRVVENLISTGNSLADISLIDDEKNIEDVSTGDEQILDKILDECGIDDIKSNFWNGLPDSSTGDDVVENASIETIDCHKKQNNTTEEGVNHKLDKSKTRNLPSVATLGHSIFNITPAHPSLSDDEFFKKEKAVEMPTIDKPDEISEFFKADSEMKIKKIIVNSTTSVCIPQPPPLTTLHGAVPALSGSVVVNMPQQQGTFANLQSGNSVLITPPTGKLAVQTAANTSRIISQHKQQNIPVTGATSQLVGVATAGNVHFTRNSGNETIITLSNGNLVATTPQQSQQQTMLQIQQQQPVQQTQPQLRNVTVQQLQQIQQRQQQQAQQQIYLQMQRDVGSTSGRHPTLTPIASTAATGNHVLYTTTGDGQKIFIQKAAAGMSLGTASTIIGTQAANIKQELTEESLIDNNIDTKTVVAGNVGRTQITIVDGNQQTPVAAASTPLLVTTSNTARSTHQQQQTQILQNSTPIGTQIVWRPINTSAVSSNSTVAGVQNVINVGAVSQDGGNRTVAGNKIVWANRAAALTPTIANKKQLNGPENTSDINKLFLNRKFAQRKIVSQQLQQHKIQITKQQLQQLQQQQQQSSSDIASGNVTNVSILDPANSNIISNSTEQQQQQQQAMQKVSMQGGKLIKMSSFPLFVSDFQQQQQLQVQKQKQNNTVQTVGTSNTPTFSLQPGTIAITSQSTVGGGNKIFLTTGSATSGGTADLQPISANSVTNSAAMPQKIHLKDLQNSNLKVNFVSTIPDSKTFTINTGQAAQQLPLQHPQKRILNIFGAAGEGGGSVATVTAVSPDTVNSKRVLYTSLLNVKSLQRQTVANTTSSSSGGGGANVSGSSMQIGTHALLRGRFANNQSIFTTNMRSLPIAGVTTPTNVSTMVQNSNIRKNNFNNNTSGNIINKSLKLTETDSNSHQTGGNLSALNSIGMRSRTPTPTRSLNPSNSLIDSTALITIPSVVSTATIVGATTTSTVSTHLPLSPKIKDVVDCINSENSNGSGGACVSGKSIDVIEKAMADYNDQICNDANSNSSNCSSSNNNNITNIENNVNNTFPNYNITPTATTAINR